MAMRCINNDDIPPIKLKAMVARGGIKYFGYLGHEPIVCTAYRYREKIYENFPNDLEALEGCEPIYREYDGWQKDTTNIRSFIKLPRNAKTYLKEIQKLLKTKIVLISVGSERKQTFIFE